MSGIEARINAVRASGVPSRSAIDGIERFVAAVQVDRYPLLAVVAIEAGDALANYRQSRTRLLRLGGAFGLLLLVATSLLLAQLHHLDASEKAKLLAEAGLRATLEGSLDAVAILRAVRNLAGDLTDFSISDANSRAAGMAGKSLESIIGQHLSQVAPTM